MDQLTSLVTQILHSNEDVSRRLASMESRTAPSSSSSISTLKQLKSHFSEDSDEYDSNDDESCRTVKAGSRDPSNDIMQEERPDRTFAFTFDKDLKASRAYSRVAKRTSVFSTSSSLAQSMGWSYFSGLSLADLSEISVINLPIVPRELWNGEHYTKARAKESLKVDVKEPTAKSPPRIVKENITSSLSTSRKIWTYSYPKTNSARRPDTVYMPARKILLLGTSP